MCGDIVVELKNGRRIRASDVEVLSRGTGEWIRCRRDEPSSRMGFDETTTYYHLENDVERVRPSHQPHSAVFDETDRRTALALTKARSDS